MCRAHRDVRCLRRATIPPPRAAVTTRPVPTAAVMADQHTAVIAAIADRLTEVPRREDRMVAAVIRRPRHVVPLAGRMGVPPRTGVRVPTAARMEAAVLTEAIAKRAP